MAVTNRKRLLTVLRGEVPGHDELWEKDQIAPFPLRFTGIADHTSDVGALGPRIGRKLPTGDTRGFHCTFPSMYFLPS